ncbi:MAG: hypothetical protein JW774_11670 [Candidatus Aureabacteria bacterium]|nr:hypothetical protein [Candidatus Auribacterota bacterium]
MSIVLDALNKAEKEREGQPTRVHDVKIHEVQSFYKKVLLFVFLGNVFLVCVLMGGFLLKNRKAHVSFPYDDSKEAQSSLSVNDVTRGESTPVISTSETVKETSISRNHLFISGGPDININGVFLDKNKGYILVGSETLGVNDTLCGMKILSITLKEVQFEYKGEVYTVPT